MSDPTALIQFGVNAIAGISQGVTARANVQAANTVNAANTYASNLIRASRNELASKRGSLQRFTQSVNNQRVLAGAGSQLEAATVNYRRSRDAATRDSFEGQLKFAEQAGAQAAAAGRSGLTGGVADVVASATALRRSRVQQAVDQSLKQGDFDASQRQRAIMLAGYEALDQTEVTDQLDYGQDVATVQKYGGNLYSEVMGMQTAQTTKAAVDFFTS